LYFSFRCFVDGFVCFPAPKRQPELMGVCVFAASGLNFDVDRYLASSPFKATSVFRKGDVPPMNNPERKSKPESGFVVIVSGDQEVGLVPQLKEAWAFLNEYGAELQAMRKVGVDNMLLDFGMQVTDKIQQVEYFPPELIMALGRLGLGLMFSVVQIPRG
jgi:hypothetical protein